MQQIIISVIVPIYNIKEEYLRKCIDTLINQTLHEIEIILIDDGSHNEAGKVCDEYAKIDKRIIVIHQENKGVSVARNVGITRAKGKWISFVDPDDFVEEDMLNQLYLNVKDNEDETDILLCDAYVNYENNQNKVDKIIFYDKDNIEIEDIKKLQLQIIYKRINSYYPNVLDVGVPWAKLYNTKFIKENKLEFVPNMKRMQDGIFNLYALENAKNIKYIHLPLYHYRKNGESVTNKYYENVVAVCEKHIFEIEKFINRYNKNQIFKDALNLRIVSRLEYYVSSYFFNSKNKKSYKQKKKEIYDVLSNSIYKEAFINVKKEYLHIHMYTVAKLLLKKSYLLVYILNKIKQLYFKILNK